MKRMIAAIVLLAVLLGIFGCEKENFSSTEGSFNPAVSETVLETTQDLPKTEAAETVQDPVKTQDAETVQYPLDQYHLDAYTKPYWQGNVVYHESVMVLEEKDGSISDIPLLYHANQIFSVRSSDLEHEYQEGSDYQLVNGKLHIPEGSTIPSVAYDFYYPRQSQQDTMVLNQKYGKGYIYFKEGPTLHTLQIAVTYSHSDSFSGDIPAYSGKQLPKTLKKLNDGENLNLCIFGDSISVGANSSGFIGAKPQAKAWFQMFEAKLKQTFPAASISMKNDSVGGTSSEWGVNQAKEAVGYGPDLCIIAFGMNDGTANVSPKQYRNHIKAIMDTAVAANPDCEFVLISTMLPNKEASFYLGNQEKYLPELKSLEREGVAVADMTTFHKDLLKQKRYFDMTGNNVNHPNDFLARAYAQVLWQTVIGYESF